ncbi:MAG: hypothetical protein LBB48_05815 [Treponema sp.]|nr:hypothetical protein [Treponema sp.]
MRYCRNILYLRRVEGLLFGGGIESAAAGIAADADVVFLSGLYQRPASACRFYDRGCAGEPDGMGFTPIPEPFVDKLAAVAVIEAQKREGEGLGADD